MWTWGYYFFYLKSIISISIVTPQTGPIHEERRFSDIGKTPVFLIYLDKILFNF